MGYGRSTDFGSVHLILWALRSLRPQIPRRVADAKLIGVRPRSYARLLKFEAWPRQSQCCVVAQSQLSQAYGDDLFVCLCPATLASLVGCWFLDVFGIGGMIKVIRGDIREWLSRFRWLGRYDGYWVVCGSNGWDRRLSLT